ncbi:MAG: hypothetical protein H0U27_06430 [Nitrosopumilus sp.]|nr:hypothetical protein [Nitrosopumilus sp.]
MPLVKKNSSENLSISTEKIGSKRIRDDHSHMIKIWPYGLEIWTSGVEPSSSSHDILKKAKTVVHSPSDGEENEIVLRYKKLLESAGLLFLDEWVNSAYTNFLKSNIAKCDSFFSNYRGGSKIDDKLFNQTVLLAACTPLQNNQGLFRCVGLPEGSQILVDNFDGEMELYRFFDFKKYKDFSQTGVLGSGGFGNVREIENLSTGHKEAFKTARVTQKAITDLNQRKKRIRAAKQSIFDEYEMLLEFNSTFAKSLPGIQFAPTKFVDIKIKQIDGKKVKRKIGYISMKYDGKLNTLSRNLLRELNSDDLSRKRETQAIVFDVIKQLLKGLIYTHKKGIIHGDIKPENILVSLNNPENPHFPLAHISDWGGAKYFVKILDDAGNYHSGIHTRSSFPLEDFIALSNLGDKLQSEIRIIADNPFDKEESTKWAISEALPEFVEIEKKRDVFALGQTIWIMLTGHSPFDLMQDGDRKGFPNIEDAVAFNTMQGIENLEKNGFFLLLPILTRMFRPDYLFRADALESLERIEIAEKRWLEQGLSLVV